MEQSIFNKFRQKRIFSNKTEKNSSLFFQLDSDSTGYFISIVNEKSEPFKPQNYKSYNGLNRRVLKVLEILSVNKLSKFNWSEKDTNKFYLNESDYLIDMLKTANNFVNKDMNKINIIQDKSELILSIIEKDKRLYTDIFLRHSHKVISSFDFLNESFVINENNIYQIEPIGSLFSELKSFKTELEKENIEKFLSLLYSYFENISVEYKEYIKVESEIVETKPAIIFEEISSNNELHMAISESFKQFLPDFITSYNLNKIAVINELEKKIIVSEIIYQNIQETLNEINKILARYKKSIKENNNLYIYENLFILEENIAKEFIHKELTNLLTKFNVYGTEVLEAYNIKTVIPKLKLSLKHGLNFLEGDAEMEIDGELINVFDAIDFYQDNSYIKLKDGSNAVIDKSYIDKLDRVLKKDNGKVKISFFDAPLLEDIIEEKIYQETFKQTKEIFSGFNKLADKKINIPDIKVELRTYQDQGFKWLDYLHRNSLGGCLADDMGLGKTLQTITLLSSIYPKEKLSTLIIMPKSLLFNWENELKKFNPEITSYTYYANNRDLAKAKEHNLILTTYAMIRNEIDMFKAENFYYVILDESQNIKNINTSSAKAVMQINAKHRLALSGTPIENNLGELYSLFRFLNPSMFGSLDDFNKNYIMPIQKENNNEITNELRKKIYPFILRRLKKDVLDDLPEKVEQVLFVDMSEQQRDLYEQRRAFYYSTLKEQIANNGIKKSQFFILQAMSDLRQIASIPESKSEENIISPKREVLMENIIDVISNGHKVLIFANYLSAIEYISEDLEKEGIEHLVMTGSTKDRKEVVEKFQSNSKYKAFLITLKTGGLGINLTAADYVFIFDPWWNKSIENQAVDRAHRMGQDKTVFSYKIITRNTIEEKIIQLQEKKIELFNSIISSDDASLKSFDEADIEFILGS